MRGSGVTIPRVEEVLTAFPDVLLNVDLKGARVAELLPPLLRRMGAEERVLAGGFFDWRLARFRKLTGGRVATSAGPAQFAALWAASRAGYATRIAADAFQVPEQVGDVRLVDEAMVRAAHAIGAQVHVWTVNDAPSMHRLLDLGVDGIVTDRPDVLDDVLRGRADT